MKITVALVLAIIGVVAANPVPPLVTPVYLPSAVSVSSSYINHGVTIPKVVYSSPIITPVITSYVSPVIKTVPYSVSSWGGLGSLGYGYGYGKGWY